MSQGCGIEARVVEYIRGKHVLYRVHVRTAQHQWHVEKRFSEFHKFYSKIKLGLGKKVSFPPKKLAKKTLNDDQLSQRMSQLDGFLQQVLASPPVSLHAFPGQLDLLLEVQGNRVTLPASRAGHRS